MKKLLYLLFITLLPLCAAEKAADASEYIIGCNVSKSEVTTGLFKVCNRKPELVCEYTIATDKITDFAQYMAPLVKEINEKYGITVKRACFAAPGNTNAQKSCIKAPHLSFVVDGVAIENCTSIERALVVNDFETIGFGVQAINPKEIVTLHEGKPRAKGTQVIVGAGNGLGSGLMLWDAAS
jgi:glucokinase